MSRGEGILRRERNFQCHAGIHRTGAGSRDHIFQEQISHKIGDCHSDYHGQTAFPGLRNACQHNRNDDPYQTAFSDRSKKTQDLCQPFLMDPLNCMQYL